MLSSQSQYQKKQLRWRIICLTGCLSNASWELEGMWCRIPLALGLLRRICLLPDEEFYSSRKELKELPNLESLMVERCFKPADVGHATACEVHHFADNSQFAYGALSYFRITDSQSRTLFPPCLQIPTVGAQATDCPSIGVVASRLDKIVRLVNLSPKP